MKCSRFLRVFVGVAVFLLVGVSSAFAIVSYRSPRSASLSVYLPTDGSIFIDPAALSRSSGVSNTAWFNTYLTAFHSYEIQVYTVSQGGTVNALESPQMSANFYAGDGVTLYSASTINTPSSSNPWAYNCPSAIPFCIGGTRYTTEKTTSGNVYMLIKVVPNFTVDGDFAYYAIRVTDTSIKNPWFFIAGDYNAFSEISNASDQPVSGHIYFWGANGALVNSTTFSLNGAGNVAINAADFVNRLVVSNGSTTITHTGGWGDIVAGCTTLSGTTGLSFDTYYTPVHGPKLGPDFGTSN